MSELDQTVLRFSLKGLQKRPSFKKDTEASPKVQNLFP